MSELSWPHLNTSIWKVQGIASRAQRPLTTALWDNNFPSLGGATWRNNGSSTRNGSHFDLDDRHLSGEYGTRDKHWKFSASWDHFGSLWLSNIPEAGDLRCHCAHYDVIVMLEQRSDLKLTKGFPYLALWVYGIFHFCILENIGLVSCNCSVKSIPSKGLMTMYISSLIIYL